MNKIYVAGICGDVLACEHEKIAENCAAVVAGLRHRPLVEGLSCEVIPVCPVEEMLARLENALERGDCMVLASGDPMFFGIGRLLTGRFGSERLEVMPALSSVQLAAARFKIPWDDISFLSLHGRGGEGLLSRVLANPGTCILTDSVNSPDSVARTLLEGLKRNGLDEFIPHIRIFVGENLGMSDERLVAGSIVEVASMAFAPLNVMIVEMEAAGKQKFPLFGLERRGFECRNGLITKDEIRAVTLHKLALPRQGVMWDIGSGSGSVAIEAARLSPALSVYAVEKDMESRDNIMKNLKRYMVFNVEVIKGEAPDALASLPDPDRVFVGGSGGRLREILSCAASKLREGGIVVVNAVLKRTASAAPEIMNALGFKVEISRVMVERLEVSKDRERVSVLNPITIVKGAL